MPINKDVLYQDLERVRYWIKRIEDLDLSQEELLEDADYQDALAFRIQQVVEKCIDIATHIIANEHLGVAENARTAFEILAQNKVISDALAKKLSLAVGMRNVIVHQYDDIDYSLVYGVYQTEMQDVKEYVREIVHFIENK